MALFIVPAIVFAFNGALSNSLPRRWVLVGTATYCLSVLAGGVLLDLPWLAIWGLLAVGSVIYYPALRRVAGRRRGHALATARINGFIEMGAALAIVLGIVGGFYLTQVGWAGLGVAEPLQLPAALALALARGAVSFLTALPVRFASDVRDPNRRPSRCAVSSTT